MRTIYFISNTYYLSSEAKSDTSESVQLLQKELSIYRSCERWWTTESQLQSQEQSESRIMFIKEQSESWIMFRKEQSESREMFRKVKTVHGDTNVMLILLGYNWLT